MRTSELRALAKERRARQRARHEPKARDVSSEVSQAFRDSGARVWVDDPLKCARDEYRAVTA